MAFHAETEPRMMNMCFAKWDILMNTLIYSAKKITHEASDWAIPFVLLASSRGDVSMNFNHRPMPM